MEAHGIEGMRPSFGFVIRAVAAEQPTITRLAEMLDVTKQSASSLADEAERAGFVKRVAVSAIGARGTCVSRPRARRFAPPRLRPAT